MAPHYSCLPPTCPVFSGSSSARRLPHSRGSAASGGVLLVTGSSGGSASSKKNIPSSHSYPLSTSILLTFGDRRPSASPFLPVHHAFVCPLLHLLSSHFFSITFDLTLDIITYMLLYRSFLTINVYFLSSSRSQTVSFT